MKPRKMTTRQILLKISQLQDIQKTNPPASDIWNNASEILAPLFSEMARRTPCACVC